MWWIHRAADNEQKGSDETNPRSGTGRAALRGIERTLFVVGLVLLTIYAGVRIEGLLSSRAAMENFAALETSTSSAAENREAEVTSTETNLIDPEVADFSGWNEDRVRAYKASLSGRFGAPIAVLQIPKIHLAVPLMNGTDDLTLNHAVGRIAGTARPGERGNIGIAGHRDGFFRGLKDIGTGDSIELKTVKGTEIYVVDEIRVVSPDDVSVLRPRAAQSLTLVTCYPFYFIGSAPLRYIVMASLTHESGSGSGSSLPGSATSTSSNNEEMK